MAPIAHRFHRSFSRSLCIVVVAPAQPCWSHPREITCFSDVFSPYVIQDGTEVRGIDVDTIAEAGRGVGIKVGFQILPWVRLERDLSLGVASDIECAFAYTLTDARRAFTDFTNIPVKRTELGIFARHSTFESLRGLEALKAKTVGIRRGFKLPAAMIPLFDKGIKSIMNDGTYRKIRSEYL